MRLHKQFLSASCDPESCCCVNVVVFKFVFVLVCLQLDVPSDEIGLEKDVLEGSESRTPAAEEPEEEHASGDPILRARMAKTALQTIEEDDEEREQEEHTLTAAESRAPVDESMRRQRTAAAAAEEEEEEEEEPPKEVETEL